MNKQNPRATVRKFFAFQASQLQPWVFWSIFIVVVLLLVTNWLLGLFGVIAGIALYFYIKNNKKKAGAKELGKLADATRAVQARDSIDSYLRIFRRTQISESELRTLDGKYVFEKERDLFASEKPEDKLGELYNKSIRMWSQGESKTQSRFRRVVWDNGSYEDFYNPIRIVSLFLTPEEMVICDTTVDSLDGDLSENITRIMLSDIVSVNFNSNRVRFSMPNDQIMQMARDMKYSKTDLKLLEKALASRGENDPDFIQEENRSWLQITRTDGGALNFPIRFQQYLGPRKSALDDDVALTEDDQVVDRMMNELNRVVRTAKKPA